MSERASLLRRRIALCAGAALACGAVLASSPAALAAGGAPVPVPDEPPPGVRIQTAKQPTEGQQPARGARVAGQQASAAFVPTPDAPKRLARVASGSTTASAPATTTTSDAQTTMVATPVAPSVAATAPRRDERRPAPKQTRAPKSKATKAPAQGDPTPVTPRFEELFRLALPVATRLPPSGRSSVEIAWLLAAAALLAGAATGGAVIGLVARRLAGAA